MTNNEQITALAKLDGWTFDGNGLIKNPSPYGTPADQATLWINHPNIPKYLTSYDAILPLIKKQPKDVQERFIVFLMGETLGTLLPHLMKMFNSTPRQLAESLLRAHGLWKE